MFAKLKETLNKFISNDNSPIILSISGGVDSIVLLNILIENYSHDPLKICTACLLKYSWFDQI